MHSKTIAVWRELNNGGSWDGYYAFVINGNWGDCWM